MTKITEDIFSEIRLHRYQNALTLCNKQITEDPANSEVYELRGDCYSGLKDFKAAIDSYNSSLDFIDINLPDKEKKYSRLFTKIGSCYLKQNNFEEAISAFTKAIRYDRLNSDAYLQRSKAYRSLKRYGEALEDAEHAVQLASDNAAAFNSRGICNMYLAKGREALADFNEAIALKPDYAQAYHNRGNVYERLLHDTENAKRDRDYADFLIQKKTPIREIPKEEEISDFNVKNIFNENITGEIKSEPQRGLIPDEEKIPEEEISKIEIPEELKKLHYEIEGIPKPVTGEADIKEVPPSRKIPSPILSGMQTGEPKNRHSVLKNVLVVTSIFIFIVLIIWAIYYSLVTSRKISESVVSQTHNENFINESADTSALGITSELDSLLKSSGMMLVRDDSGLCLQAGSFRDKALADEKVKELEDIGFDVNIIDVQDSVQGALYKVRFGRYENLTEIDSVIKIYKNE
jgi:tetratricopeptide (TPR) repeat protein